MSELKIELKQNYKQFKEGFKQTLKGNLIILSGINGSGKTQLIDILDMQFIEYPSITNPKRESIDSNILIEDKILKDVDIFRRSFRDNIIIENIKLPEPKNKSWNKEQAWKAYSNYNSWEMYYNTHSKAEEVIRKVLSENGFYPNPKCNYGMPNNTDINITKEEFYKIVPDNFIWEPDDLFENRIDKLFYEFAAKRQDVKAELGEKAGGFNNGEYIKDAPWTILNEIFEKLKFSYRFKEDYTFTTPNFTEDINIFPIKSNGDIDTNSPRKLSSLSDGEKSIISLTFALLNEKRRPIEKLLLLDEFDNTLNPSLIEALFKVLKEYFIDKGVVVVMTTHSPVTISLAPDNATFYELFKQDNDSPKILQVQKEEYTELKIANKEFYNKITNQKRRIKELEKKNSELEKLEKSSKPLVIVEDYYTEIYKIAYLKLNDIEFNQSNVHEKFDANANFEICWQEGSGGVAGLVNCVNLEYIKKPIIGLFDYDREGVEKYKGCKNFKALYEYNKNTGIYKKRENYECYALLLPVPERLNNYVQEIHNEDTANNYFEVEHYLPKKFIEENKCFKRKNILGQDLYVCKKEMKKDLWKDLIILEKDNFQDFVILFNKINELLKL